MEILEIGQHLQIHPGVCHGQLIFKGTRVPVQTILNRLAQGRTIAELQVSWPEVPTEAILEAIRFATAALLERWEPKVRVVHDAAHSGRPA